MTDTLSCSSHPTPAYRSHSHRPPKRTIDAAQVCICIMRCSTFQNSSVRARCCRRTSSLQRLWMCTRDFTRPLCLYSCSSPPRIRPRYDSYSTNMPHLVCILNDIDSLVVASLVSCISPPKLGSAHRACTPSSFFGRLSVCAWCHRYTVPIASAALHLCIQSYHGTVLNAFK